MTPGSRRHTVKYVSLDPSDVNGNGFNYHDAAHGGAAGAAKAWLTKVDDMISFGSFA